MFLPAAGLAQTPSGCESELTLSCTGMRISVCPCGDFESIAEGCGGDSDNIEIIVWDRYGVGIAGIPPTDYWMNSCDPAYEMSVCVQHLVADSLTGSYGRTTFSGQIAAGGCVPSGGIRVSCQGVTILNPVICIEPACLDMVIVSPDINGDGMVNSSDLSFFGQSYNKAVGDPDYNDCCDYTDDGICNLSDFSFFGEHYLHGCM